MLKKVIALALASSCLCSCTTISEATKRNINNLDANRADFDRKNVHDYVTDSNAILNEFKSAAGLDPGTDPAEWLPVVKAGMNYVDVRCKRYMDALSFFDRVKGATSRQIEYTGATASAALALLNASKELVGLTPLAFSYGDDTINNIGKGLLFDLPPSSVKAIVTNKQATFKQSLSATYPSKAVALQVIQDYADICLVPSIEADVVDAVSSQKFENKPATEPTPAPAPTATPTPTPPPDTSPIIEAAS